MSKSRRLKRIIRLKERVRDLRQSALRDAQERAQEAESFASETEAAFDAAAAKMQREPEQQGAELESWSQVLHRQRETMQIAAMLASQRRSAEAQLREEYQRSSLELRALERREEELRAEETRLERRREEATIDEAASRGKR